MRRCSASPRPSCNKTRVIDVDLAAYFDDVRHHLLSKQVARRVNDPDVSGLLKLMLRATGKKGVPQGGVMSRLLINVYLNEVDRMLERAKDITRHGKYTYLEYARFADDRAPRRRGEEAKMVTQTQPCGTRDEGRPLGAGWQLQTTESCCGQESGW